MRSELPPGAMDAIRLALAEDLCWGDPTTDNTVPAGREGTARYVAREPMVVCGLPVVAAVLAEVDPALRLDGCESEGTKVGPGALLATACGPLRSLLRAERVSLNFIQRLSGVATSAARYAEVAAGRCRVVDTRKTTPGLRGLEKYAVRTGGCHNHRMALGDGLMIKDNHIAAAGDLERAVRAALAAAHHLQRVEVEADSVDIAERAIAAGARHIMLDNFSPSDLAVAVARLRTLTPDLCIEASGGINLGNLDAYCNAGPDVISCGSLVHGARWVDVGLDFDG